MPAASWADRSIPRSSPFIRDGRPLLSALPAVDEDWLGWHERFLGRSGPAWVAGLGEEAALRLDRLSPALLNTLWSGTAGCG